MDMVRKKFGGYEGVYIDMCGRVGGLVMLWEKGNSIFLLFFFLNYINFLFGLI